jgi:hypothetical protein
MLGISSQTVSRLIKSKKLKENMDLMGIKPPPIRIWANTHWEVTEDGMASLGPVDYFIPKDRLCELRDGFEGKGISMWPLHIAEKSWAPIEPFLEAYQRAIQLLKPRGLDKVDFAESAKLARELAFKLEWRRR